MAEGQDNLDQYIERIPTPQEIRDRLSRNLREAKLLRALLRISEQRQRVREVVSCER